MAAESRKLKIFISYSRRETAIADALFEALAARGFEVTIDRLDLPFGEKWQLELAEFIRLSDTVVWLVSEASVQSKWVNWELDEVARRNKRLVPVMVGDTPRATLPRQIGEIHILPADGLFDRVRDLDALVQVLNTDRIWLKQASRLQDRAVEWQTKSRAPALLLSRRTTLFKRDRYQHNRRVRPLVTRRSEGQGSYCRVGPCRRCGGRHALRRGRKYDRKGRRFGRLRSARH
jgi:hypothetical protein